MRSNRRRRPVGGLGLGKVDGDKSVLQRKTRDHLELALFFFRFFVYFFQIYLACECPARKGTQSQMDHIAKWIWLDKGAQVKPEKVG